LNAEHAVFRILKNVRVAAMARCYRTNEFVLLSPQSSKQQGADRMNRRGEKPGSKLGVNMSFSDLVQRIIQRDANGVEQKLEKPKQKEATAKLPRRRGK
jgi:hypothetical protein